MLGVVVEYYRGDNPINDNADRRAGHCLKLGRYPKSVESEILVCDFFPFSAAFA